MQPSRGDNRGALGAREHHVGELHVEPPGGLMKRKEALGIEEPFDGCHHLERSAATRARGGAGEVHPDVVTGCVHQVAAEVVQDQQVTRCLVGQLEPQAIDRD